MTVVSQESTTRVPAASHTRWLPSAQQRPEKRFWYEPLLESGVLPDALVRFFIRRMLRDRLREEDRGSDSANRAELLSFVGLMSQSPIALRTDSVNAQHYEVPAAFFARALGPRLKYSSAFYGENCHSLAAAEAAMLQLTCERAQLADGQDILELGCGWGSLTLWIAERYPNAHIIGVSNSASQRQFILSRAAERGLRNVQILTADMNEFSVPATYDRVVSVEMFEHMRNWQALLAKISSWMKHDGKLFIHIFTHTKFAYPFEVRSDGDWMARHFFAGGMMPSDDLLSHFDAGLRIQQHWQLPGTHYQKTSEAWLRNMDKFRSELFPLFAATYGSDQAKRWWIRWRIFFMACAELWGYRGGSEWIVSHYLLAKSRGDIPFS